MNKLTRNQAYESMKQGNKITHWLFSDDEYLWIDDKGIMRDECGYNWSESKPFNCSPWAERSGGNWNNGWEIWKGDK